MGQFAWPGVGLILGVLIILLFRREFRALIGRGGFKVGPVSVTSTQSSHNDGMLSPTGKIKLSSDNAYLQKVEDDIKEWLREGKLSDSEAIPVLIRELASTRIHYWCEYYYSQIYGSQLAILSYLNVNRNGKRVEDIKLFYDNAAKQYPEIFQSYSFESYLKFLETSTLIILEGELYKITIFGAEFLSYLAITAKSSNKNY